MTSKTQGERLAALERGLSDHESRCEERLADIKDTVASTEAKIDRLEGRITTLILAVGGFCAVTLIGLLLRGAGLAP